MTTSVLPMLSWPIFEGTGVEAGVTTRHGGVSTGPYASLNLSLGVGDDPAAVAENRARVATAFGADLVFAQQVHGRAVALVDSAGRATVLGEAAVPPDPRSAVDRPPVAGVDALVSASPGPALVILVADCVPIVLADPQARVVGVVHAGWRGTVAGVTPAAVEALVSLGAVPERILAGIGPAISAETYQVGSDVADAARDAGLAGAVRPDGTGRCLFDLVGAARQQLADAGVRSVDALDAVTGGDDFFSHRAGAPTGRFAAVARLVP